MAEIGKLLIFVGITIFLIGVVFLVLPKVDFRGLPGDIYIKKDNFVFFFPIVTSIVISILLTVVLSIIFAIFGKKGN
ncbi:MAG: DUF2905 domain-containing protein [Brevinematales bacterium]|nr:DUF2905 domain-containing protein [Brevinematales bacterium]